MASLPHALRSLASSDAPSHVHAHVQDTGAAGTNSPKMLEREEASEVKLTRQGQVAGEREGVGDGCE